MTDPRQCCAACELDYDSCLDIYCPCHDGITSMDAARIRDDFS